MPDTRMGDPEANATNAATATSKNHRIQYRTSSNSSDSDDVHANVKEATAASSSTSVLELTKDLLVEEEEEASPEASGVDWGWGNDTTEEQENPASGEDDVDVDVNVDVNANANAGARITPIKPTTTSRDAAEDSDVTAEMSQDDDDDDDDDDESVAATLATQSPLQAVDDASPSATATATATATDPSDDEHDTAMETDPSSPASATAKEEDAEVRTPKEAATPESSAPSSKMLHLYESSEEEDKDDDKDDDNDDDNDDDDGEPAKAAATQEEHSSEEEETSKKEEEEEELPPPKATSVLVKSPTATAAEESPTSVRGSRRARRKPSSAESSDEEQEEQTPKPRRDRKTPKQTKTTAKPPESSQESESVTATTVAADATATTTTTTTTPDEDDLLRSTDYLFLEADKDQVTVADICRALAKEYDCKLTKAHKRLIREHLIDLMKNKVQPQVELEGAAVVAEDEDEDEEKEEEVSEQGDSESDQSEFEDDAAADGNSNSDGEEFGSKTKRKTAKKTKKKQATINKRVKAEPNKKLSRKRPNQRKAAKAARIMTADRIRKKRMEELRVRNEEMQLNESKEDQERAEAIAAKFETNTDELRLKRLEDRLTLLELLDKKRIAVIDALETKIEQAAEHAKEPVDQVPANATPDVKEEAEAESMDHASESEESSSDEEELDIIGAAKPFKPLKPIHTHMPSRALSILKQIRSPKGKSTRQNSAETKMPTSPSKFAFNLLSPTKSHGGRSALQKALKQRQRRQGNLWLARELGYKTEADHLKDCQSVAEKKRTQVVKLEQARVESNDRRLLKERILRQDEGGLEAEGDNEEETNATAGDDNEEDEEMLLAKEIGEESGIPETSTVEKPSNDISQESTSADPALPGDDREENVATSIGTTNDTPKNGPSKATGAEAGEAVTKDDREELPAFATQDESQTWETQPPPPTKVDGDAALSGSKESFEANASTQEVGGSVDKADDSKDLSPTTAKMALNDTSTKHESEGSETSAPSEESKDELNKDKSTKGDDDDDDDGEEELKVTEEEKVEKDPNRPRNAAWQAMLKKEAEARKKQKKRKGGLVEDQAEEEEEEEVAGLEDFGFSVKKKKQDDEDENPDDDKLDEEDLKHVVDDISDDEGDEEAGDTARRKQEQKDEKEQHKAMLRRMREGYDGRRGGIAGSGVGARGIHRFDQLVAADNREDAKRLGLLNDDEMDSDNEGQQKDPNQKAAVDEDDETALLDKMLKDRFLHRSSVEMEENFSEDEDDSEETKGKEAGNNSDYEEERTQERLAKRFAKRARMQRLEEEYAESQEFSQQRLIDEDETMRQELSQMKNGLIRKRSTSSSTRSSVSSQESSGALGNKRPRGTSGFEASLSEKSSSSLSIALRASRKAQRRTSFLGGSKAGEGKESGALIHKSVALSHVVFTSSASRSTFSNSGNNVASTAAKRKLAGVSGGGSLFHKVASKG